MDWLYNAPATGAGQNTEELEAYLLGKKSVEQLFKEQDRQRVRLSKILTFEKACLIFSVQLEALKQASAPASGPAATTFQAVGSSANNVRDLAAKVREDPLLAIKRQEQKAYEELMKNPKKLKELREAREAASGKKHRHETEEERQERKRRKKESKRSREASPRRRSRSPPRRRAASPPSHIRDPYRDSYRSSRDSAQSYRDPHPSSSSRDHRSFHNERSISRPTNSNDIPDRAARLAAMTASAARITADRDQRIAETEKAEQLAADREAAERQSRLVKGGGRLDPTFLKDQQAQMLNAKLDDSSLRKGNSRTRED